MPGQIISTAQSEQKPKRLFGLFPAIVVVATATALAAGLWSTKTDDSTTTVTASALPQPTQNQAPAPAVVVAEPESVTAEPPAPPIVPAAKESTGPEAKEKREPAKAVPAARLQPPVARTYEITRSTRVYTGPSELSQAMGDIEPGVRVNVVNAKDGWLEIHSKHGRPPGFIRKEGARVIAQN
jgi:hypothetical protein